MTKMQAPRYQTEDNSRLTNLPRVHQTVPEQENNGQLTPLPQIHPDPNGYLPTTAVNAPPGWRGRAPRYPGQFADSQTPASDSVAAFGDPFFTGPERYHNDRASGQVPPGRVAPLPGFVPGGMAGGNPAPGARPGNGYTAGPGPSFGPSGFTPNSWTVDSASRQRIEQALLDRLQPQFDRQLANARTALLNSGVEQDSDAYRHQMESIARQHNDARLGVLGIGGQEETRSNSLRAALQQQAYAQDLGSAQFDNATRQQQLQELLMLRQQPLAELAMLMGQPLAMPTQGTYYTNSANAPDMVGAAGVQQQADAASRAARNAAWQAAANFGGQLLNYFGGG